jgi:DNA replication and repair protein RecF
VHLVHLGLTNFRNYARLELDLPAQPVILLGDNGQGKSNLLEAIYLLSTTRSWRSQVDAELIDWRYQEEGQAFARVVGALQRRDGALTLEVAILGEGPTGAGSPSTAGKRIKVNGSPKRAFDLVGQAQVVMFGPQDIDLVQGPPQSRRRYLDIALSLLDGRYMRALSRYNRVLAQRNQLLRQIKAGLARPSQLPFWNEELVNSGSFIIHQRIVSMASLEKFAAPIHLRLSGGSENLQLLYRSSLEPKLGASDVDIAALRANYADKLALVQEKELVLGVSLLGPHRDDFAFLINGRALAAYGSRGQQRTAVLALRLAEVEVVFQQVGEPPILLLDDVMSELDGPRRGHLREAIGRCSQSIITATDPSSLDDGLLANASRYRVVSGAISPL